jgi:RNA polymerase sigma factor (sigma-70 family)
VDEASGEDPGAAARGPGTGDDLPPRRVPGQRDPVARPEPAAAAAVPPPASPADLDGSRGGTPRAAPADRDVRPAEHPGGGTPEGTGGGSVGTAGSGHGVFSDAELVALVRAGRDSAYAELYRRHADSVRRYARTCCRDAYTAEDLTAEIFARTLQAIRGGGGPESAVRAYLLTVVRRVAASWGSTAKREQLVEDFAVFAVTAADSSAGDDSAGLGADVWAMREAERSLAIRAFRTLPERWQTVLWHTAVEEESPSAVAPLLGLTPNATAVLAHRAREGLRQAYLQAHVSSSLTAEGECARYADRLGAHTRGGLRLRADRELSRHLKECTRCSAASLELADLNSALKGLLPAAYIGWFAAAYAAKAAGAVMAGAAGGAAAAASGSGGSAGAGATGGAAAAEGLGAPVKVGIAATAVVGAAATVLALALTGGHDQLPAPVRAEPPAAAPVATAPAPPPAPAPPSKPAPKPAPKAVAGPPVPSSPPKPEPEPATQPTPAPQPSAKPSPSPTPVPEPAPRPTPTPSPTASPTRPVTTPPPPVPVAYRLDSLPVGRAGAASKGPAIRPSARSWRWDRWGLSIAGTAYRHGVTVHAPSTLTVDLNRSCVSFDARAGVDDLVRLTRTTVDFAVYGDGTPLWSSGPVHAGDPAVPAHVGIKGYKTIELVVRPGSRGLGAANLADWADAVVTCV